MPKFEPNKWNKDKYTRKSHNCYAYFLNKKSKKIRDRCRKRIQTKNLRNTTVKTMNKREKCRKCFRPKPGKAAGLHFTKKNYNCRDVVNRVLLDNKSIRKTSRYGKCPKKHYKGVVFLKNNYIPGVEWFHFARQDSNKKWSHKSGRTFAEMYDINKRVYRNPNSKVCSHFCVPDDSSKLRMKEEREFIDCRVKKPRKSRKSRKSRKKYLKKRK